MCFHRPAFIHQEMKNPMRLLRTLLSSLFVGAALSGAVAQAADPWPSKPIKVVIPFSAGGVQDALGRSISEDLGRALGQAVKHFNVAMVSFERRTVVSARKLEEVYDRLVPRPDDVELAAASA